MNLLSDINRVEYIHRPISKISVGAIQKDGKIVVAAAFAALEDNFSRKTARELIVERLKTGHKYSQEFDLNGKTPREFMRKLRGIIKPDEEENDRTFNIRIDNSVLLRIFPEYGDETEALDVYIPCTPDEKWEIIKYACLSI